VKFDSEVYRSDMEQLQALDPINTWDWRLEELPPLAQPVWACTIPTTSELVTFKMAAFRNPAREECWDISPVFPPYNAYPDNARIVLEVIGEDTVPVIEPAPPQGSTLGDIRDIIQNWVNEALGNEVTPI
jgi:hypothetical protein